MTKRRITTTMKTAALSAVRRVESEFDLYAEDTYDQDTPDEDDGDFYESLSDAAIEELALRFDLSLEQASDLYNVAARDVL